MNQCKASQINSYPTLHTIPAVMSVRRPRHQEWHPEQTVAVNMKSASSLIKHSNNYQSSISTPVRINCFRSMAKCTRSQRANHFLVLRTRIVSNFVFTLQHTSNANGRVTKVGALKLVVIWYIRVCVCTCVHAYATFTANLRVHFGWPTPAPSGQSCRA